MPQPESERKGKRLLVLSADYFTEPEFEGVAIRIELPRDFNFEKRGAELLKRIESASMLFTEEAEAKV